MKTIQYNRMHHKVNSLLRSCLGVFLLFSMFGVTFQGAQAGIKQNGASLNQAISVSPSVFGVEMPNLTAAGGLDQMTQAGTYWVRKNGLPWSAVQPSETGALNWGAVSGLETELINAANKGLQVILVVYSTPQWAQQIDGVSCGPIRQDKLAAFGNFMNAVVARYSAPPYNVKYWEIWNEPDITPGLVSPDSPYGCWGDENDVSGYYGGGYYADMLQAIYPRIRAADANAQVLVGGLLLDCDVNRVCPGSKAPKFLEGILDHNGAKDGANFFDGVSYHAYDYYGGSLGKFSNANWNAAWNSTGVVGGVKADFIRSVLTQYGASGKYVMDTESALVCDSGCDATFETTKAYYVAQSYASAMAYNLRANVWYTAFPRWRNSWLLNADLSTLPAYDAYQFAQSELMNTSAIRKVDDYSGVTGYEFSKGDRRVWLIWSLDGSNHAITLPSTPLAMYHVDGTPISLSTSLLVTLEPVYVELPPHFYIHLPRVSRDLPPLANGNFEQGVDGQGNPLQWMFSSGGSQGLTYSLVSGSPISPAPDANIPLGSYSVLLGSPDYPCTGVPLGFASINQTFGLPDVPSGTPVTLSFKYIIYSQDASISSDYDRFEVHINDGSDHLVFSAGNSVNQGLSCSKWFRVPSSGWGTGNVDLVSPVDFRGKKLTLSFQNWSRYDNNYNTFTYLDDVEIKIGN